MLKKIVQIFGGDPNKRKIEKLSIEADEVRELEKNTQSLSDEALRGKTTEFRRRLALGETLNDILPEAFAVVREASKRTIGLRHYDIQMVCGMALHEGVVAEMRTGEGKTLVATLPIYLNALPLNELWQTLASEKWGPNPAEWFFEPLDGVPVGKGVHLVTVNDYLARRDARWMAPIYNLMGLSVGVLQMAARTEYGKKAFLVDLSKESPHEDQNQLVMVNRKLAYDADITYGTTNEYGFDYLRDNMTLRLEERVQRSPQTGGYHYAVIDEVDNVLIDEARTPLIISGPSSDQGEAYVQMAQVVRLLNPEDYIVDEKSRAVALTEVGEIHVEQIIGEPLRDPERPEDITPEQAQRLGYLEQALRAQHLFKRNKDYLVQGRKVIIIDESTGRLMPGRRWSDGLHQAVEAKEGVQVQSENITYATITIQNYYRKYAKLSGMTGTAATEAEEFFKIYSLNVLEIPPNLEFEASRANAALQIQTGKDEEGYTYTYYVRKDSSTKAPAYFKRKDYPDVVYRTEEAKFRSIVREILRYHTLGRPMLVGTTSVELSDRLSNRLKAEPIRQLALLMLLRQTWLEKNNVEEDGRVIPQLDFLNKPFEEIPQKERNTMARDLGVPISPLDNDNLTKMLEILGLPFESRDRLKTVLSSGIPHQVLNARKHTEESKIIETAGAFGAVTIATNMAGRGVDIVLGGSLEDEVLKRISRVARDTYTEKGMLKEAEEMRAALNKGAAGGYGRTSHYERLKKWRQVFPNLTREQMGIYEADIRAFDQFLEDHQRILALGGLHVIGSERHDARRIDNQLRGRAARQGDPGSSRFYLSMQDDLMRLFGGAQAEGLMGRLRIDESLPIEMGVVSRIVESSQSRVEGANFDTRKHLLEYDDVLNAQREIIYGQRDRVFGKEDLTEDVNEMLRAEIELRIPTRRKDDDQAWRLVAWLGQIQPSLTLGSQVFPSFMFRLLVDHLVAEGVENPQQLKEALLQIARQSILAEKDHLLNSLADLLARARPALAEQIEERTETLEALLENLADTESAGEEGSLAGLNDRQLQEELTALLRMQVRLVPSELRTLRSDPKEGYDILHSQVVSTLSSQTLRRVITYTDRFLGQEIKLDIETLSLDTWDEFTEMLEKAIEEVYTTRLANLLDPQTGLIAKDIDTALPQVSAPYSRGLLLQLVMNISTGAKAIFDQRTKQRVWQKTNRLQYVYFTGQLLQQKSQEEILETVSEHLDQAIATLQDAWGNLEINRLANHRMADFSNKTQAGLVAAFEDEDKFNQAAETLLRELPQEQLRLVRDELGRQAVTEIYRQLLVGVITEQWVEYLTQIEALRVSIGLEAYAQRDPLVQYKSRASEMFQELLKNIRVSTVNRMFTFQPRDLSSIQAEAASEARPGPSAGEPTDLQEGSLRPERGPNERTRGRRKRNR